MVDSIQRLVIQLVIVKLALTERTLDDDELFYKAADFKGDPFNKNYDGSVQNDQKSDATVIADSGPEGSQKEGNFFMDVYSLQTGPKQVEFGHVFEDPVLWEQRYEKKDHENSRFQGQRYSNRRHEDHYEFAFKRGNDEHTQQRYEMASPRVGYSRIQAKGGDKDGGYWEQYWDYNHGGDNHGDKNNNEGDANETVQGTSGDYVETNDDEATSLRNNRSKFKAGSSNIASSLTPTSTEPVRVKEPQKPKLGFKQPKYFQLPPSRAPSNNAYATTGNEYNDEEINENNSAARNYPKHPISVERNPELNYSKYEKSERSQERIHPKYEPAEYNSEWDQPKYEKFEHNSERNYPERPISAEHNPELNYSKYEKSERSQERIHPKYKQAEYNSERDQPKYEKFEHNSERNYPERPISAEHNPELNYSKYEKSERIQERIHPKYKQAEYNSERDQPKYEKFEHNSERNYPERPISAEHNPELNYSKYEKSERSQERIHPKYKQAEYNSEQDQPKYEKFERNSERNYPERVTAYNRPERPLRIQIPYVPKLNSDVLFNRDPWTPLSYSTTARPNYGSNVNKFNEAY